MGNVDKIIVSDWMTSNRVFPSWSALWSPGGGTEAGSAHAWPGVSGAGRAVQDSNGNYRCPGESNEEEHHMLSDEVCVLHACVLVFKKNKVDAKEMTSVGGLHPGSFEQWPV